jgi:hypothetical protein
MARDKNTSNAIAWSIVHHFVSSNAVAWSTVQRSSCNSLRPSMDQKTLYDRSLWVVRKFKNIKRVTEKYREDENPRVRKRPTLRLVHRPTLALRLASSIDGSKDVVRSFVVGCTEVQKTRFRESESPRKIP